MKIPRDQSLPTPSCLSRRSHLAGSHRVLSSVSSERRGERERGTVSHTIHALYTCNYQLPAHYSMRTAVPAWRLSTKQKCTMYLYAIIVVCRRLPYSRRGCAPLTRNATPVKLKKVRKTPGQPILQSCSVSCFFAPLLVPLTSPPGGLYLRLCLR